MKIARAVSRRLPALLLPGLLAACSSLQPQDFSGGTPVFAPEHYFDGTAEAWGVLEDGSGNPTQRFHSEDIGHRDGDAVVIDQTIRYDDGKVQKRSWRLKRVDAHHYEGTADDIVGVAEGQAYGNALQLDYTLAPDPGNPFTHVHLTQWLYLQEDGRTVLSRTTISKLGIVVARAAETVQRQDSSPPALAAP